MGEGGAGSWRGDDRQCGIGNAGEPGASGRARAVEGSATLKKPSRKVRAEAQSMLTHWQEAVPNDRLAHLVKDVTRAFVRALQARLAQHGVTFGHWTFLRVLWETDGLTQRELSDQAGVMEPTTFAAIKAMEKLGYVV